MSAIVFPQWGDARPNAFQYWKAILRPNFKTLGVLFLAQTFSAICQVMMPLSLSLILKEMVRGYRDATLNVPMLTLYTLMFVCFAVSDIYAMRKVSDGQQEMNQKLRQTSLMSFFHHLQQHSHQFIINQYSGSFAARIMMASNAVSEVLWILMIDIWPAVVVVLGSVFLMLFVHPAMAAVVLLWAVVFFGVGIYMARQRLPQARNTSAERVKVQAAMSDMVSNLVTVKSFAQEDQEIARFKRVLDREYAHNVDYAFGAEKSRVVLYFSATVFKVIAIVLAAWAVLDDANGVAHFVLLAFLTNTIISYAHNGTKRMVELLSAVGRISLSVTAIIVPHDVKEAPDAVVTPFKGDVEFRNVSFSYETSRAVFSDLSVRIPRGQSVGLVGASGAGKSSFTNLLLRLYDVDAGAVLIDGIDVRQISLTHLYEQIAIIPQDPVLFHRNVMENIRYGRHDASDEEVIDAAKRGACHEFISALPEQYAAMVGERGVKLSGGQRQRIAIARALLKNAPIILLDEATSALDSITEAEIQQALNVATRDKTLIVVAHRLSTIKDLDRILVFADGKIVEDGNHNALLAQRGYYFDLWSRQIGEQQPDAAAQIRPLQPGIQGT